MDTVRQQITRRSVLVLAMLALLLGLVGVAPVSAASECGDFNLNSESAPSQACYHGRWYDLIRDGSVNDKGWVPVKIVPVSEYPNTFARTEITGYIVPVDTWYFNLSGLHWKVILKWQARKP